MAKPDTWYVEFRSGEDDRNAAAAETKTCTFKSEIDAKLFTKQLLARGFHASAGTLEQIVPEHTIGTDRAAEWSGADRP